MKRKKVKINAHCPVSGCQAKAPHASDPIVAGLIHEFGNPERLALWAQSAMAELTNSIYRDLTENKIFAWHTRLRQPEELYFRTLYALFIASTEELPHIVSGAQPNGLSPLYDKVNTVILGGRGELLTSRSGLKSGLQTNGQPKRRRSRIVPSDDDLYRLSSRPAARSVARCLLQTPCNVL